MRFGCSLLALLSIALWTAAAASQVLINECISSNVDGIRDEENDTPDWIELCNPGFADVDLSGYGISDDVAQPFQWVFGDVVLHSQDHLLIFASGKDRHPEDLHWETVIDWGDDWRYRANFSEPPEFWREWWYNASSWDLGPSGFGFGDDDDSTEVPVVTSISIRKTFHVDDPENVVAMILHVDFDDAFVAWLNGKSLEVARQNITSNGPPGWRQYADSEHEAQMYQGLPPDTYFLGWVYSTLRQGTNVLAIEVHNAESSDDVTIIPFLTLGMIEPPAGGGEGLAEILHDLMPHMHTNFRLSADGETVSLHDPQGAVVYQSETGQMCADVSRGRAPDGAPNWVFFTEPTPEAPNAHTGFDEFADAPIFSVLGGLYDDPLSIELISPDPNGVITYTTGGAEPDEMSTPYTTPIQIAETSVIRARAFETGTLPSSTVSHSYILNDPSTLAVASFVTDPDNLWDEEIGIFHDDNLWEDWERPMHVGVFDTAGATLLSQDAGVKVYGGASRNHPQKSMRLIARGGYGSNSFDHTLFDEKPIASFKQLVWRNSGNDWCETQFRDGLMHHLLAHTDIDRLAYRPMRAYINGEYWGILNVRERIDEDYIASNHGVDPDDLDLIKMYYEAAQGDPEHYLEMLDYIEEHGLADPEHYAHIETLIDVEEYADYQAFEIYYANTDWPGNNIAYWRPRSADGRWRWIIYDTDFGLGHATDADHNTLAMALDPNGTGWPNPRYATFLFRSLMENETFRQMFINRYADYLNTSLLPSVTTAAADAFAAAIEPEIARHFDRWNRPFSRWEQERSIVDDFLNERPEYAREHIRDQFDLGGEFTLSLDISPPGAGAIHLAAIDVDVAWSGEYFEGVPISLTAVPDAGYAFLEWSDPTLPDTSSIVISPDDDYAVTAVFEQLTLPGIAVINEINYNSADTFDPGDWVELHNPGDLPFDMGGWTFKDEDDDHTFVLPAGLALPPNGFIVLCADTTAFTAHFPDVSPVLGNLGFGFSGGGELLRLFDSEKALYDWVEYDDDPPWPPEPDGHGPTLELTNPYLDNSLASSWMASPDHGTPGATNSAVVGIDLVTVPPLSLLLPSPNPFNPRTRIRFSLDRSRRLDLEIYDVAGRRVRVLATGSLTAGLHTLTWDGRNESGHVLPSGVYWLLLDAEGFRSTVKLVMIR